MNDIEFLKEAAIASIVSGEMKERNYPTDYIESSTVYLGELLEGLSEDLRDNHPNISEILDQYVEVIDDIYRILVPVEECV